MKNGYDRYDTAAPDLRETDDFKKFCNAVFSEIKRLKNNATYAKLSGKDARFYRVAYEFNLAIECLEAEKRITKTTRNGATVFQICEPPKELPKPTQKQYHDKSCARIFARQLREVYPARESFLVGVN